MGNKPYLYPYSEEEAKRRNKLPLWLRSHNANVDCKKAIDKAIQDHFDGMHLADGCIHEVIADFGYKRTAWVLSNTLQQKDWDGRFSPSNAKWAKQTYIPSDPHLAHGFPRAIYQRERSSGTGTGGGRYRKPPRQGVAAYYFFASGGRGPLGV